MCVLARWSLGLAVGGTLLAGVACAGTVAWYAAWPWLDAVPDSLALGAVAAAAVTLVVPFTDSSRPNLRIESPESSTPRESRGSPDRVDSPRSAQSTVTFTSLNLWSPGLCSPPPARLSSTR